MKKNRKNIKIGNIIYVAYTEFYENLKCWYYRVKITWKDGIDILCRIIRWNELDRYESKFYKWFTSEEEVKKYLIKELKLEKKRRIQDIKNKIEKIEKSLPSIEDFVKF
jgi:hypothetical protein